MARTVNHYFNTLGGKGEQRLVEDLIVETIRINGMEIKYIPRTLVKADPIFGEDPLSKFERVFPIEMYFDNPSEGFGANPNIISKFGFEMRDSANFIVARRRFNEAVLHDGWSAIPNTSHTAALKQWNDLHQITSTSNEVRPMEGDLIYLPLTNDLFQIRFAEHESVFYQVGYRYIWRIDVQKYDYSSEQFKTGDKDIDRVQDFFENMDSVVNDPLADNETLLTEGQQTLDTSETNIFGDPV